VPGCYPTAISLALFPALAAGLAEPSEVVVTAVTGTSGAGKSLKPHLLGAEVMGSLSAYGVGGGHRHTPGDRAEPVHRAGLAGRTVDVSFTPVLAPLPRGILASCSAPRHVPATAPRRSGRSTPRPTPTSRSCTCCPRGPVAHHGRRRSAPTPCTLQTTVDPDAGRLIVVAAIDNLTKGTAGAAVQCMNLALGLPETAGLPLTGVAP
jgi:N-acetyl-gamma-glutamyl-phosphate reductase